MVKGEKLQAWHSRAMKSFNNAFGWGYDVRRQVNEALRFVRVPGAQWEGSTNSGSDLEGVMENYPRFELNKVARECDRIISEYRKQRITVRFRPNDTESSEELSEKLNGKFRADYEQSSGNEAFDNAFDDAVAGGFGCFRLEATYEDELDPLNERMKTVFRPVFDAAQCVWFDQDSKEYDRSDATWAMEVFSMTPDAFEDEWPDASMASMPVETDSMQFDWCTPAAVYVGRYYEVKVESVTLKVYVNPMTSEVAVYDEDEIADIVDELEIAGFEHVEEKDRKVKRRRVYCGLMSGQGWLEEPQRIPGSFIPLIPVYGKRWFVDNMERIEGHAAKAMDAQRLENLMVSMVADNATQSGGDNIPIIDIAMIPGALANAWSNRNKSRPAFLPMTSVKDKNGNIVTPASVMGYTPPTPLSPAVASLLQYCGQSIQQITGSGMMDSIPSNIATDTVDSIFNRMDTQSFIYMDNMAKSVRHCGKVWLSMQKEILGTDTEVRVVNEDGTDDVVMMTGAVIDRQTGKEVGLNDLSAGRYEVVTTVGQSFSSRRDQTIRQLTELLRVTPPTDPKYNMILSMIIVNMDGEGLDGMREFIRNELVLAGVEKPRNQEEKQMVEQAKQNQQQQPDPMMVAAEAEMQKAQADMINAQTKSADVQIKAFSAQQDAQLKQAQTIKTLAEADDIKESQVRDALKMIAEYNSQQNDRMMKNSAQFANR